MKNTSILIVDDEQRFADMLAGRLALRGFNCTVRYDGRSAIEVVAQEFYPMAILDLRLPDMDGTEVLAHIKNRWPATQVAILTGHGTEKDRELCVRLGAHAFMNKPVDIERLLLTLAEMKV